MNSNSIIFRQEVNEDKLLRESIDSWSFRDVRESRIAMFSDPGYQMPDCATISIHPHSFWFYKVGASLQLESTYTKKFLAVKKYKLKGEQTSNTVFKKALSY